MAKPANKPRKKANGYKMPDPLPNGLILQDILKKKWKLGPSIGKGGFGEIYSAQEYTDSQKKNNAFPYVIKIEPHVNGPLFVEMHFYMRNAKPADIAAFISEKKLSGLGMPKYLGSGSHEYKGEKYRFVVMEKFGSDIWKLFLENKRRFPVETVFKLGVQILDVLEYIHSKGYVHADVKGANVLMGIGKEAQTQVYLVDFGLCSHYDSNYKPDPKKAHNGTIEYLSRDAHLGVQSRRGDLEILGYNLTQWLGCVLPWEKSISDPVTVQNSKQNYMDNLPKFFKACFGDDEPPAALVDYLKYVTVLKFETDPDYKKLRKILISGVDKSGGSLKSPLKFKSTVRTPVKRKAVNKSVTPEKKAKISKKVESESEEEIGENEVANQEKKKRGRKAKATPKEARVDAEEDLFEEQEIEVKKKAGKRNKPEKKAKVESEPEEEIGENEVAHREKKKPGRRAKETQVDSDEDLFEDQEKAIKKKPGKRNKSVTPEKKAKVAKMVESEPEEEIDENEFNNQEKKKRGHKAKETQVDSDEDLFEDQEIEVKKKLGKRNKTAKQPEPEINEEPGNGFTAEMQRIQDKITAKKKPKSKVNTVESTNSERTMRKRPNVNYNENLLID